MSISCRGSQMKCSHTYAHCTAYNVQTHIHARPLTHSLAPILTRVSTRNAILNSIAPIKASFSLYLSLSYVYCEKLFLCCYVDTVYMRCIRLPIVFFSLSSYTTHTHTHNHKSIQYSTRQQPTQALQYTYQPHAFLYWRPS